MTEAVAFSSLEGHRLALRELLFVELVYWGHRDAYGRVRQAMQHAQGSICPVCGEHVRKGNMDHVLPKSRGGYDGLGNLLYVHKRCNTDKADRLPTGCEIIWLVGVCAKLGVPVQLQPGVRWQPPPPRPIFSRLAASLLEPETFSTDAV